MERDKSNTPIVHWEIMGPDGSALRAFYAAIFDWQFDTPPGFDDYQMVGTEQMPVGGAVGQGGVEMSAYAAMYVQVDSIDETLAQIEAAGGRTLVPRMVIPNTVVFGMFHDPAGNLMALVEGDM